MQISTPGIAVWPAEADALKTARTFIREHAARPAVLACHSDVDGLTSGLLALRALERLHCPRITPLVSGKAEHVHQLALRERIAAANAQWLLVTDMGSTGAEPIVAGLPTLIIDHHQPLGVPTSALLFSGFGAVPVPSSSELVFETMRRLTIMDDLKWLAMLGAVGDYGADALRVELSAVLRVCGRKHVTETVALLNAARRSAHHRAALAFEILWQAREPADIAKGRLPGCEILQACRMEVKAELNRCAWAAPKFAKQFALVRFSSSTQIHPLLASRWANRLKNYIVIAANDGYLPDRVCFSMRTNLAVNVVDLLRGLRAEIGGEYAYGHPQATGGSVAASDFEILLRALGFPPREPTLFD